LKLEGLPPQITAIAWSPNGGSVAAGSSEGLAKMWDAATGVPRALLGGHTRWVSSLQYSPRGDRLGERLVTTSWDGTAKVWNTVGEELRTLMGHTGMVRTAAWSPDGKLLATSADDGTARIWDSESGKELTSISGNSKFAPGTGWSPDGTSLVVADGEGNVRIWGLDSTPGGGVTAKERLTLEQGTGQSKLDLASLAAYSPDGRLVVTTDATGRVAMWDSHTGQMRGGYAHHGTVTSMDFSPDGCRLATSGEDGQVMQADTCIAGLVRLGRQYAGRSLTNQERMLYLSQPSASTP
jgi:WD40 repeat protein